VTIFGDGRVDRPAPRQAVTVRAGRRVTLNLASGRHGAAVARAVVLDASTPVVVERSIVTVRDDSRSPGVVGG
jgi:hypothetical protein